MHLENLYTVLNSINMFISLMVLEMEDACLHHAFNNRFSHMKLCFPICTLFCKENNKHVCIVVIITIILFRKVLSCPIVAARVSCLKSAGQQHNIYHGIIGGVAGIYHHHRKVTSQCLMNTGGADRLSDLVPWPQGNCGVVSAE